MYCMKCGKNVYDCECPDIDERLAAITAGGKVILNPEGMERKIIRMATKNLESPTTPTEPEERTT